MKEAKLRVEPMTREEQAKREKRMYEAIQAGLIKLNSFNPFLDRCIGNVMDRLR